MASFSSSEISTMISSKKYRVKRGDSLSLLAEKFQNSFPSLKGMNKSSLMDKIYNVNRSAFGGNKDQLYEGRDFDLKFMPMPMKTSSSSSNKMILQEIKRNLSGDMVSSDQIVEKYYKMMGKSASNSEIQNLAVLLEKENGTCRHSSNVPCSAQRDKIDQLSAKSFNEAYGKIPLGSNQLSSLDKGFYTVTAMDKWMFLTSPILFWPRIIKISGFSESEFHKIREAAGLKKDRLEGDHVFVPSKRGRSRVSVKNDTGVSGNLSPTYVTRLQDIGLYANYLAKSIAITEIVITSQSRTAQRQAEIVYADAINYPNTSHTNAMYKKNSGEKARKWIKQGDSRSEVIADLKTLIIGNPEGFKHVNNSGKVIDIGAGPGRQTTNTKFKESFIKFQQADKWISRTNSIPWGSGGEKNAYHTVFR